MWVLKTSNVDFINYIFSYVIGNSEANGDNSPSSIIENVRTNKKYW